MAAIIWEIPSLFAVIVVVIALTLLYQEWMDKS